MTFTRRSIPRFFRALARTLARVFSKDPVLAGMSIQTERARRCQLSCPHYAVKDDQCRKCTCVVSLKVMMAAEECPIGSWRQETRFSSGL